MLIRNTEFLERSSSRYQEARNAHRSVPPHLRSTDPLLRYTDYEILHQVNPNPSFAGRNMEGEQAELRWDLTDLHRYFSGKLLAAYLPPPDDVEMAFRERWYEGGDYHLLREILDSGRVPLAWSESWSPMRPRTLNEALQVARQRGYNIPERFLNGAEGKTVSFSESEAFYAAYMLVSGNYDGWQRRLDRNDVGYWRPLVCQLTGQFIIPDPLEKGKTPYIVDQLWIVASPSDLKVRLLALEIDGEIHLGEAQQERSRRRDAMLLAMGIEVFHIAGWWCRIDPFRAVCRFLEASRLASNLTSSLVGSHLSSIDDYVCELCGNPIVRQDGDWLWEIMLEETGGRYIAHDECASYLGEYMEYGYRQL